MNMFKDKRGQGLSTSAIILIILGVVILAVLVIGFTVGWNTLFPFLERNNNVDQVAQNCELACTTGSVYDWCQRDRELKGTTVTPVEEDGRYTCEQLSGSSLSSIVSACPTVSCPAAS